MTFYDYYKPNPPIACPICGEELEGWEGFDGPCVFVTFNQGAPGSELPPFWNDPAVGGGTVLDPSVADEPHPGEFEISSDSCSCEFPIVARCKSDSGVWRSCELFTGTPEDRRQLAERRQVYRRRMRWLDSAS